MLVPVDCVSKLAISTPLAPPLSTVFAFLPSSVDLFALVPRAFHVESAAATATATAWTTGARCGSCAIAIVLAVSHASDGHTGRAVYRLMVEGSGSQADWVQPLPRERGRICQSSCTFIWRLHHFRASDDPPRSFSGNAILLLWRGVA